MTSGLGLLRLVRVSIALSPIADVVAGAALAAATGASFHRAPILFGALASLSLFCLGMSQNDLADRRKDARSGRERPIPTGMVSVGAARSVVIGSLLAALTFALCASAAALGLATAIVLLISLYNLAPAHLGPVGPVVLGSIRALNLTLGAASLSAPSAAMPAAAVYLAYITTISFVARMEDGEVEATPERLRRSVRIAAVLAVASPVVVILTERGEAWTSSAGIVVAASQSWRLSRSLAAALASGFAGATLPRLVGTGLSGIFLIDAAVVLASGSTLPAVMLLGFFAASRVLVRRFPPS